MIPLRVCPQCQRWFSPSNRSQWLCGNCANESMSKTVLVWFAAFVVAVISLLVLYFLKQ